MPLKLRDRRGRLLDWETFRSRFLSDWYATIADDEIVTNSGTVRIQTYWTGAMSVPAEGHEDDELDVEDDEVVFLFETKVVGGRCDGIVVGHHTLLEAIRRHDEFLQAFRASQSIPCDPE